MKPVCRLATMEELCDYVRAVLCEHDRLEPSQTPLARTVVRRRGRPCGLFFQLHGPRRVRTYAVWAGDENRILFYDSLGVRFAQAQLSEAPDPRSLA